MCSGYNINITKGIDFFSVLTVKSKAGPVNLSGYNVRGGLRFTAGNTGNYQDFSVNIQQPYSSGVLIFSLTSGQTANLPVTQFTYYLEAIPATGTNSRLAYGYANVNPLS